MALFTSNTLAGFLFEIEPIDPTSLLVAAGTLLGGGVLAALVAALRASSTDPAGGAAGRVRSRGGAA